MNIHPQSTLGEIVTEHPDLAGQLERRGFDYCCGGRQTLAEACAAAGLDPQVTAEELSAADSGRPAEPWSTLPIDALVDHLERTHHAYLWDEMPRLGALVDKITAVHGDRHPELVDIQRCYASIRADLEPHLLKEERVLFPMIRELAQATSRPEFHCGTLGNPISVMLAEHDRIGELLAEMRALTDGYTVPADGCASYTACFAGLEALEADTHAHVHKENNTLFPNVVAAEQACG